MDLSTVNLQAQLQISFLDIWKWLWHLQTEFRKSKLLDGHLGMDFSTVNLKAEFQKFLFGSLKDLSTVNLQAEFRKLEVVVAPAN